MLEAVVDLDRSHVENAIPPLLMVVVTACTTDLMAGFATGCVMYTLLVAGKRGLRAVSPMLWGIDAVLVLYLALAARIG
jgi:AGZA family xanthine/uracil permease-like MFS transporter